MTPWLLLALPAAIPAAVTVLNLLTWPRGRPTGRLDGRVSVLIPARDEAANIAACVAAVLAQDHPVHQVVVFDDGSTDATPDILARLAADHPVVTVVNGDGLPPGWVGKPHACHQLARHATGDVLLFVDADVTLHPEGLSRLADLLSDNDVVTAFPDQHTNSLAERLMMPLLCLTYTAWLPLLLIPHTQDPRVLAANGQVLAIRRGALDALGGFAAVRQEVVDDMALCRLAKGTSSRVCFADGARIASCRMYRSGADLWAGFSKNLYEGIGGSIPALAGVILLYTVTMVLPFVAAPVAALVAPAWLPAALAGVTLNLLTRAMLAARFGHSPLSVLLHPIAVIGLLAIAVNSARWSLQGAIHWRGRTYAARGQR